MEKQAWKKGVREQGFSTCASLFMPEHPSFMLLQRVVYSMTKKKKLIPYCTDIDYPTIAFCSVNSS